MDYLTENVDRVIYKDEPLYPVGGKNMCVYLWEPHETHKYTVSRNAEVLSAWKIGTYDYQWALNC
jgi:hypothetical protein